MLCLVPEGSQVLHISHGWIKASREGNVDVEADAGPTAHLQREAHVTHIHMYWTNKNKKSTVY